MKGCAGMPKLRRKISITFNSTMTPGEYAQMANAVWSIANMSGKLWKVEQDSLAKPADLNDWYEKDGRAYRWEG
jgi:hypothetical protein